MIPISGAAVAGIIVLILVGSNILHRSIQPAPSPPIIQTANGYSFIVKWGSKGISDGQFHHPTGVAVDSSGNVYVSDSDNDRVQKFSSNGTFITKWGSKGISDGQFNYQYGVAVDSSGNVYVADTVNHRIQVFSPSSSMPAPITNNSTGK